MIVDAKIPADDLVEAVKDLGGTVIWADGELPARRAKVEVEVDNDEAFDALPSHFFDDLGEDPRDVADEGDVRDFVGAVARGDRLTADALASRLWCNPRNRLAYDRAAQRGFML